MSTNLILGITMTITLSATFVGFVAICMYSYKEYTKHQACKAQISNYSKQLQKADRLMQKGACSEADAILQQLLVNGIHHETLVSDCVSIYAWGPLFQKAIDTLHRYKDATGKECTSTFSVVELREFEKEYKKKITSTI